MAALCGRSSDLPGSWFPGLADPHLAATYHLQVMLVAVSFWGSFAPQREQAPLPQSVYRPFDLDWRLILRRCCQREQDLLRGSYRDRISCKGCGASGEDFERRAGQPFAVDQNVHGVQAKVMLSGGEFFDVLATCDGFGSLAGQRHRLELEHLR